MGHLYTHKGELVTISPHYCRIGTSLTLFGDVVESLARRRSNRVIDSQ